jgi:CheY-like chemotaxis protein
MQIQVDGRAKNLKNRRDTCEFSFQGLPPLERKILIVEDHPDSRDLLALYLRMQGYTVYTAEDGREGLKFVQLDCPHLLITDLSMPHMDGIALIKHLRQMPECQSIPIIVMTAYSKEEELEAIKAGASETIPKPIEYELLINRINALLPS